MNAAVTCTRGVGCGTFVIGHVLAPPTAINVDHFFVVQSGSCVGLQVGRETMSSATPTWYDIPIAIWVEHLLPFLGDPGLDFVVYAPPTEDAVVTTSMPKQQGRVLLQNVPVGKHPLILVQNSPTEVPTQTERALVLSLLYIFSMLEETRNTLRRDQVMVLTLADFYVEVRGYKPLFGMTVGVTHSGETVTYEALCTCSRKLPGSAMSLPILVRHPPVVNTSTESVRRRVQDVSERIREPLLHRLRRECRAHTCISGRDWLIRLCKDVGASALRGCANLTRTLTETALKSGPIGIEKISDSDDLSSFTLPEKV